MPFAPEIHPFVQLLGTATEQLSLKLGQTLSGLLNASFGNAVEIIVGVAALLQGHFVFLPQLPSLLIFSCNRRAPHCPDICTWPPVSQSPAATYPRLSSSVLFSPTCSWFSGVLSLPAALSTKSRTFKLRQRRRKLHGLTSFLGIN